MNTTTRLVKIEQLIRHHGCVSMARLMEELEVSRATLKRDLDVLRDQLGAPIVFDKASNGYRLGSGSRSPRHELPGLWFSERELYALLSAQQLLAELDDDGVIHRHLQPLLDRIHDLLAGQAVDAQALLQRVKIVGTSRRPVAGRLFELASEAVMRRRRLQMRYLSRRRGEVGEREVSPQRLVYYRNTWYLDAWCHSREALLRFALDAVQSAQLLEAAALELPLAQVAAEMDRGYGIFAGVQAQVHWATLRFAPAAAPWVSHEQWHPQQKSRWLEDGSYELELPYTEPEELARDLMRHGADVQISADSGALAGLVKQRTQQAWLRLAGDEAADPER